MKLGLKASVKDLDTIIGLGPDFIETFIRRMELVEDPEGVAQTFGSAGLPIVVHAPEYYDDIFVDLASTDEREWRKSVEAVSRSVKLADELGARHIVVHPGGVSDGDIDRSAAIKRLRRALLELSYDRFFLENMPWFYFQAGHNRVRCNIMVDPADYEEVLDVIGGMTVDICHGFLSTEGGSMDYLMGFFDLYPGIPRYVHISDAMPPDGEGLQLGEGAIDLDQVYDRLRKDDWWGIPEIMDGHKDGGAGFVKALDILRRKGL